MSGLFVEPEPGTTLPDEKRCYFSDLTEEQLMPSFRKVPKFRFVPCKFFLTYNNDDGKATPRRFRCYAQPVMRTYDPPTDTAHTQVGSGRHQLFGSIQAAAFSLDPASPCSSMFNRNYNDPILVPQLGFLSPHNICYCSIPFSTSVTIAAKLNVTTDKVDDVKDDCAYYRHIVHAEEIYNDAFEICNNCEVINFSDYFAKRPNGGSDSCTLKGRDGYLKLYYVALKYAVDAALEVAFESTSKETKVVGRVMAYYGKNFHYGSSPDEKDDYKAMLFETKQHDEVKPGKINLMRSVLPVPAQFSLIIDANLSDSISGDILLSGVYEFFVPADGSISHGVIKGIGCSLKLKVDWKLPLFSEETTPAKSSYFADLAKKQGYSGIPKHTPKTMDVEKDNRWSLQEEFKFFYLAMKSTFPRQEAVSVSISPGTEADGCDYLCTSVLDIWPDARSVHYYEGPKDAGMYARKCIGCLSKACMLKSIVVGGPGFLKLELSGKWIAASIHKVLMHGIGTLAPKLPVKKTIIDFLSRNVATEMHMDHIRSAIIGETLARILEYSRVHVQRRFQYGDHLDIKSKMMMTELLIDRFPNGEVDNQAIGELEVLYKDSKKRFDEDAEFRKRAQQDWRNERHQNAWVRICKISRARYQKLYHHLGVCGKEEGKELYDQYIRQTRNLLMAKGLTTKSEGDETIFIEGRKLPLVDIAALWHALEIDKADRIMHVSNVGQRDDIELCITVAKSLGLTVNKDPLSHVTFGFVQVEDYERFRNSSIAVNFLNLLDEAKSRCREVLVGQGKAKKWTTRQLEHTAEALGYGAVKYAHLKNNRLTNYTFRFDQMLDEKDNTAVYLLYTYARICLSLKASSKDVKKLKVETLELKNGAERVLGLHLLRFTEVLGEVCRVLAPHIMCEYLYELCYKFNDLYSSAWQVDGYAEESKFLLFEATKVVMGKCLDLFGITRIDKI